MNGLSGKWRHNILRWGLAPAIAAAAVGAAVAAGASSATRASGGTARPTRCSAKAPRQIEAERWRAARHVMAPAGPTTIRLCRYSGLNDQPALTLAGSRNLSRQQLVAELVRRFDRLSPPPPGAVACPADDGSQIVALLSYPGPRLVRISVGLTGCNAVTNGTVHRVAAGYGPHPADGPRLLKQLQRLVGEGHTRTRASGRGRWKVLARSPLGKRSEPVVVWDGRELLEIGGTPFGRGNVPAEDTGAAYDPATGRWHQVARAPASVLPSLGASTWTGHRVFVFSAPTEPGEKATNVAGLYNPATDHWTVSPRAPVGPLNQATAVWTGREVILAGIPWGRGGRLAVTSFTPATNRWALMHPRISRRHPPLAFAMVETDRGVLLWSLWSRTRQISPTTSVIYSGVDVFRLGRTGRWTNVTARWPQHQTVDDPVFTGRSVLLAPGQIWCGACSHPAPHNEHGFVVDPTTLHVKQIPHGPLDDTGPQILWTGRSELSLNFGAEIGGPVHAYPGDVASWEPKSGRWTRGPRAPRGLGDPPAVWTGKRLLVLARDGHLLAYAP